MSDMFTHCGINGDQKKIIIKRNITEIDLLNNLKFFDPNNTECKLTKLSLMYYMDQRGDFQDDNITKPGLIANAIFESLDDVDKIDIFRYTEFLEEEIK